MFSDNKSSLRAHQMLPTDVKLSEGLVLLSLNGTPQRIFMLSMCIAMVMISFISFSGISFFPQKGYQVGISGDISRHNGVPGYLLHLGRKAESIISRGISH
jgi:hypothetical protein